ncbi:MAG: nuclease-related domain-containing protein [Acidimicrobiales bacterium]
MDDPLLVAPWKKFGKHRLYVNHGDGRKVGYHDVVENKTHVEIPELTEAMYRALDDWWLANNEASEEIAPSSTDANGIVPQPASSETLEAEMASPSAVSALLPKATTQSWTDLSLNLAGAGLSQEAARLRAQAPIRTLVNRVVGVHTDERAWRVGAGGEHKVGEELRKLMKQDPRWHCIHNIPAGKHGRDIDHLVMGPGGVYSINTKCHPKATIYVSGKTFKVNGFQQPYLSKSWKEAEHAALVLSKALGFSIHVTGMVVPVDAGPFTIKVPPSDVGVINRGALVDWLQKRGHILDAALVSSIFEVARRSTTWLR